MHCCSSRQPFLQSSSCCTTVSYSKTTARYWYRNWKRLRPWSEWFSSSGVSNRAHQRSAVPRSPRCDVTNYCEFQKFTATTNEIESNESNESNAMKETGDVWNSDNYCIIIAISNSPTSILNITAMDGSIVEVGSIQILCYSTVIVLKKDLVRNFLCHTISSVMSHTVS